MKKTEYGRPAIGCYLDQGYRNATEHDVATVRLAESFGFEVDGEMERILESVPDYDDDHDGETLDDIEALSDMARNAEDWLNEQETRSFLYWSNCGDRGAFGLWPDVDGAREDCEFVSVKNHVDARHLGIETDPDDSTYPPEDYRGEWLHVSDHGNATLYARGDDGKDIEIWSVV